MAIPFNVEPDADNDEVLLQQLHADLWQTLQQIDLIQRPRRGQNQSLARVFPVSLFRRRRGIAGGPVDPERRPLVNLAMSSSPVGPQNDLQAILQPQNLPSPIRRRRRRRTRSESSCCEETKPVKVSVTVEVTNNKWTQQDCQSDVPSCRSESLLSKLVPAPLSGPLWTAVICVVGWHLLRAR